MKMIRSRLENRLDEAAAGVGTGGPRRELNAYSQWNAEKMLISGVDPSPRRHLRPRSRPEVAVQNQDVKEVVLDDRPRRRFRRRRHFRRRHVRRGRNVLWPSLGPPPCTAAFYSLVYQGLLPYSYLLAFL